MEDRHDLPHHRLPIREAAFLVAPDRMLDDMYRHGDLLFFEGLSIKGLAEKKRAESAGCQISSRQLYGITPALSSTEPQTKEEGAGGGDR